MRFSGVGVELELIQPSKAKLKLPVAKLSESQVTTNVELAKSASLIGSSELVL